jgi:hypothetical protein
LFEENNTAPGFTITVGLYTVTRPNPGGVANAVIFTASTEITGSGTGRAASGTINARDQIKTDGATFAIPTAGYYALGANISGTWPANAATNVLCELTLAYE